MRTSKTIAGLIGPTLVAVAVAVVASAIVLLVLGAILSFKGYSRE